MHPSLLRDDGLHERILHPLKRSESGFLLRNAGKPLSDLFHYPNSLFPKDLINHE